MIYSYLLPPAYLKKVWEIPTSYLNPLYWAYVLHPANTAIRRTNRNINREASAVLYRDILLVSIEWRNNSRVCLDFNDISHRITFNLVPRGAPLPPYVVRIRQQDQDGKTNGTRVSTIFAAADFPAISRLLLEPGLNLRYHMDEARTSFSVASLPKMGYNVDKLKELIWSPLLAIREGVWGNLGETHRKSRLIDCTGVFEQVTAELDWDPNLDDGEDTDQKDESGESNTDDNSSQTDTSGEEDDDEEDIGEEYIDEGNIEQDDSDEEDSDEEDSDEGNSNGSNSNGDSNDDGSIDEEEGSTDDEGHRSSEATASKHRSKDIERRISNRASSTSGSEGDVNPHFVVKDDCVAGGRPNDKFDHKMPGGIEAYRHVGGIADKQDAEEH